MPLEAWKKLKAEETTAYGHWDTGGIAQVSHLATLWHHGELLWPENHVLSEVMELPAGVMEHGAALIRVVYLTEGSKVQIMSRLIKYQPMARLLVWQALQGERDESSQSQND